MARRISSPRTTSTRFFAADWEVHYNSSPTGVRLIGPKPDWARDDGGEAGLHPSQHPRQRLCRRHHRFHRRHAGHPRPRRPVPRRLRLPGRPSPRPSCGRWASCTPATKSASRVSAPRRPRSACAAGRRDRDARARRSAASCPAANAARRCIVGGRDATAKTPSVAYRRAGDAYLLIEYGPIVLDLGLRFRVACADAGGRPSHGSGSLAGIIDLTPGIRSLQIHYDPRALPLEDLIDRLHAIEDELGDLSDDGGGVAPRAPAAVVERRSGPSRHRQIYARRARRRAMVPVQHRVHPPHQRLRLDRGGEAHRLRRHLSRARPGRRLSRRAGGDPGRSAPPPRHHQIQSGAHLDAGQCRRHRRRLSLHLRHGGAGRLPALRAHLPDVEHLSHHRGLSGRQALAAALLRPDRILSGRRARSFSTSATASSKASARSRSSRGASSSRTISPSSPRTPKASRPSRRSSRRPSTPSGRAGKRPA